MQSLLYRSSTDQPLTINGDPARILIVDDERAIREFCKVILDPLDVVTDDASCVSEARQVLEDETYDIILTDIEMPGEDGLDLLHYCREKDPNQVVIFITGHGTVERAVDAMKGGAFDFLEKPLSPDAVRAAVRKGAIQRELALENLRLRALLKERYGFANLIGKTRMMQEVYSLIQRVAPTDTPVLIQGESGAGKKAVAHAIYVQSNRNGKGLYKVCCSALPKDLLESELFGHVRGAFPGATTDKKGVFRQANQATLLLENIDAATPDVQLRIYRALQEGELRPIGAMTDSPVDVRLIANSARNLREEVQAGRFREDLFYKLAVVQINLPPLRERRDDLPLLVRHFLDKFTRDGHAAPNVSPEAMHCLMEYSWPGNIRELASSIERASTLCTADEILPCDLPEEVADGTKKEPPAQEEVSRSALISLEEGEKRQIRYIFDALNGHRGKTATILQISRRSLYDKLKRYGICE